MKLRCVVAPNANFKVDRYYDVVEILELPGHAIAPAKPDRSWPRPGEPFFGMHPEEYFEPAPAGIPTYSCGYRYVEEEFFGVIIPNSLYPTPPPVIHPNKISRKAARILKIVENAQRPELWSLTYHRVLTKACWPDTLEREFLTIGFNHDSLGRQLSYRAGASVIRQVMRRMSIHTKDMPAVDDQQLEFWQRYYRNAGTLKWRLPKQYDQD